MTLIKSISGIRGTIGGKQGEGLTPLDIVNLTCAFAKYQMTHQTRQVTSRQIVIGRDGRQSGEMVTYLVRGALMGMGVNVIDLGLTTTPSVELAVKQFATIGGIILTASHNPAEWNALKLLNDQGEFLDAAAGKEVLKLAEEGGFDFANIEEIGSCAGRKKYVDEHIRAILTDSLVDRKEIAACKLRVVVDGINSGGGMAMASLLKKLGVDKVAVINAIPNGKFAHNPEPLPKHLKDLSTAVLRFKADLGIAVDPDVDRLAFVCQDGSMFGEEYTLVAVADYVLRYGSGAVVSNMSSTRALRDVATKHNCRYYSSAVGEVNVVAEMKRTGAIIGGEGNGGVIYPGLHYGRDALMGAALFLSGFAERRLIEGKHYRMTDHRASFPKYVISKNRVEVPPHASVSKALQQLKTNHAGEKCKTTDGLRIDFEQKREWVHLRSSNTEPIMRVYAEAPTKGKADALAQQFVEELQAALNATVGRKRK